MVGGENSFEKAGSSSKTQIGEANQKTALAIASDRRKRKTVRALVLENNKAFRGQMNKPVVRLFCTAGQLDPRFSHFHQASIDGHVDEGHPAHCKAPLELPPDRGSIQT